MKTKPLTQNELATLASNLPAGTAKERVRLALEIWMEADPARAEHSFWNDRLAAYEDHDQKIPAILLSFDKALETIFPDSHPALHLDLWERFREWQRENGIDVDTLEQEKNRGIFFHPRVYDEINDWRAEEKRSTAGDKSSSAGLDRWWITGARNTFAGDQTLTRAEIESRIPKAMNLSESAAHRRLLEWIDNGLLKQNAKGLYYINESFEIGKTPPKTKKKAKS